MKEKVQNMFFDSGAYSELMKEYVAYKRSLGFIYGRSYVCELKRLNTLLNEYQQNELCLTKPIVNMIIEKRTGETSSTQVKRASLIRQFAVFISNKGYAAYIYPDNFGSRRFGNFTPYIFSHEQISKLFETADKLQQSKIYPTYHIVIPAILRMLYGCGMRISEVLKLKREDVDLKTGVALVRSSKNGTSRYVPLSESLNKYCLNYADRMLDFNHISEYFFPARDGGRYATQTIRSDIKKIYAISEIPLLGNGRLPRMHDLRHTYCCHAMAYMKKKGFDLYYTLPIISAYVGHKETRDTERYLRLTEGDYNDIIESEGISLSGVIPEVISYEEE
jgi:integrase